MKDLEQAKTLLLVAGKDYKALQMMEDEAFPGEIFGFHVQQAVEKALKAWLCCLGIAFPRIHDLDELVAMLHDVGQAMPEGTESLLDYTDFAVTFRYDALPDLDAEIDRPVVTEQVGRLLAHVRKVLSESEGAP